MRKTAAILGLMVAFLSASATARAETDKQKAKKHFNEAEVFYQQAMFRKALEEYRKAHQLSSHPALVFNMAQCHRQLGEHKKALFMYKLFLSQRPNAPNREEVEQWIGKMKKKVAEEEQAEKHKGRVSVTSQPAGADILVDQFQGTPVATTPTVLKLKAGTHLIVVRKEGYETAHKNVTVKAGELTSLSLTLPEGSGRVGADEKAGAGSTKTPLITKTSPAGPKPFYKTWWFWTGAAASVALGLGGTVTGVLTLQARDDWTKTGDTGARDTGKTLRTVTDVLLGAAILTAAGVTVGALVVHYGGDDEDEKQAIITPSCGSRSCSIWATGTF
jgi:hypothetical protein